MAGPGYNPHTFSIIHNQPKAPLEDEGQEEMFMKIIKSLSFILLSLAGMTAGAQTFEVDGINYNVLSVEEGTAEVTRGACSGEVVIPAEVSHAGTTYRVTTIGDEAFYYCYALTSVSMPSVTTIGDEAFYGCYALTSVSMPSVTTIGDWAFYGCSALTSVSMPSVTTIDDWAFYWCFALESVDIPASCTSIGSYPFAGCTALKEIVVDDNNPNYSSADGVLYDKGKTTLLSWPTAKGGINLPLSVTKIGVGAFCNCSALTSVSMPSVTTIGEMAFYYCDALTSVSMPVATTIGVGAFEYCSSLTSIDIPASVTMIGDYAFYGCSSLTSVYCHWEQPLECYPGFEETVLANATLYVPDGCVDAYRAVKPWSDFANIEEKDYSGIAESPQLGLSVKVIDGAITVEGGDSTASAPVVEVYSAGGVCVYRGTDTVIGGLPHGVYVVKVGGTVQKVAL